MPQGQLGLRQHHCGDSGKLRAWRSGDAGRASRLHGRRMGSDRKRLGCAVMTQSVRILRGADLPPDRTVGIALWGGEGQGPLGSEANVKYHVADPGGRCIWATSRRSFTPPSMPTKRPATRTGSSTTPHPPLEHGRLQPGLGSGSDPSLDGRGFVRVSRSYLGGIAAGQALAHAVGEAGSQRRPSRPARIPAGRLSRPLTVAAIRRSARECLPSAPAP